MLSAPFALNSTMVSTFSSLGLFNALDCDTIRDRFVVVIQLRGANDGLNTIIRPEFDSYYQQSRSDIYLQPNTLLSSTESAYADIRLHPSMTAIRDRCNDGSVNIVQSVGYPIMNRSHFKATDLWLTGGDGNNQALQEGWMGKYLEYIFDGYGGVPTTFMPDPLGIHMKSKNPSLGFHTQTEHLKAINMPTLDNGYYTLLSEYGISSEFFENLNCFQRADYMKQLDLDAAAYGQRIADVFANGSNSSVNYGSYDLGTQLKTVARLVDGGSRTKIFLVEMTGFDTHVNQLGNHANLLDQLSESVNNFMQDLENLGHMERGLIVTFSEFGRKFTSNNSNGTDHGTLAPMLVFGHPDKIVGGVSGPSIDVTSLDSQGAPVVTDTNNIDYRKVFISILKQWLGANNNAMDEAFGAYTGEKDGLELIQPSANATPNSAHPLLCYTTDQEYEHEFSIVIPITQPEPGEDEPALVEITACDYVDLLPGFHAPCSTNVIVYPLVCPPDGSYPLDPTQGALAVFKPELLEQLVEERPLYTRITTSGEEIQLLEKFEQEEKVKINIFPNPTADYLTVKFNIREGENKVRIDVLDANGRLMPVQTPSMAQSLTMYEVRLDISHLNSGHYYLRYQSEKLIETFRFVKL